MFLYDKTKKGRSRLALNLPKRKWIQGMDVISIIFAIASQLGGWSNMFVYVSICDVYLPGFKILPSVQFFARMWHVAILVTSGLCRAIYWPPSAASTIYLPSPLLFSSLAITRYLLLFLFCLFLFFFIFFSLSFVLCILFSMPFLLFPSGPLFLSRPSLTIELNQRWNVTSTVPELRYLKLSTSIFCSIDSYRTTNLWII